MQLQALDNGESDMMLPLADTWAACEADSICCSADAAGGAGCAVVTGHSFKDARRRRVAVSIPLPIFGAV